MTPRKPSDKARARIVRFLARGEASPAAGADGRILLDGGERGTISVEAAALKALSRAGIVEDAGGACRLSATGRALARRKAAAPSEAFVAQHREMTGARHECEGQAVHLAVNAAESPLSMLAHCKGRDGRPFLTEQERSAGDRLRADYATGRLMPSLGASWTAPVSSGRRSGGGIAELTDAALAARQRVERALAAVGPELAGVLIDICCFLKSVAQVEMERSWPVRSAKVVLKTARGALHRHYQPPPRRAPAAPILHWGAEDFRPDIGRRDAAPRPGA